METIGETENFDIILERATENLRYSMDIYKLHVVQYGVIFHKYKTFVEKQNTARDDK